MFVIPFLFSSSPFPPHGSVFRFQDLASFMYFSFPPPFSYLLSFFLAVIAVIISPSNLTLHGFDLEVWLRPDTWLVFHLSADGSQLLSGLFRLCCVSRGLVLSVPFLPFELSHSP